MYKLLLICLCFKLADLSLTIKSENRVVEDYVLRIIEHLVSPETTVLYVYDKTNNYLPRKMINPKITADVTKTVFNAKVYKTDNELVIIDLERVILLREFLIEMKRAGLIYETELSRKYLVIIPNLTTDYVKKMFKVLYYIDIINMIMVTFDPKSVSDTITVYTCDVHLAVHRDTKFERVLQSFKYETINSIKLPGVLDKYRKCVVQHIITHPVHLYKYLSKMHYLIHFIKSVTSKVLNVTFEPVIDRNSAINPIPDMLAIVHRDFRICFSTQACTTQFYKSDWVWVVPTPEKIEPLEVFRIIFKKIVWLSILITFVLTSIVWWLICRYTRVSSFTSVLLDVYSLTIFGSLNRVPWFFQLRVLFIAYIIYAIPIQTLITSNLIRLMTVPQYELAINSIEEITASGLPVIVPSRFKDFIFSHGANDRSPLYNKIKNQILYYQKDDYIKTMEDINIFKNATALTYPEYLNSIPSQTNQQYFIDNSLLGTRSYAFAVKPRSLLVPSINKIISMLLESGLLDHTINEFEASRRNYTAEVEEKVVLTLTHVYPVFAIWGIGICFATVVFIRESKVNQVCLLERFAGILNKLCPSHTAGAKFHTATWQNEKVKIETITEKAAKVKNASYAHTSFT
ncbi:hypothetical protein FQA39_LY12548 [Lamprigera yunnana]|nr:hypothetical protein FQA39_LY12548 [Lamprigera yunnana]